MFDHSPIPPCASAAPRPNLSLPTVKSPKSDALPVDVKVIYSIVLSSLGEAYPPARIPLVWLAQLPLEYVAVLSPISCVLPVVAIVSYSITSLPPTKSIK